MSRSIRTSLVILCILSLTLLISSIPIDVSATSEIERLQNHYMASAQNQNQDKDQHQQT